MNIDERALGPQIGQAINLAFKEQLNKRDCGIVDLKEVRKRAKEILILNIQITTDIKKALLSEQEK